MRTESGQPARISALEPIPPGEKGCSAPPLSSPRQRRYPAEREASQGRMDRGTSRTSGPGAPRSTERGESARRDLGRRAATDPEDVWRENLELKFGPIRRLVYAPSDAAQPDARDREDLSSRRCSCCDANSSSARSPNVSAWPRRPALIRSSSRRPRPASSLKRNSQTARTRVCGAAALPMAVRTLLPCSRSIVANVMSPR